MVFFREPITEQHLSLFILRTMMDEVQGQWPQGRRVFCDTFGADNFVVANEEHAPVDLMLAAIALEIEVAHNAFPAEQAWRITQHLSAGIEAWKAGVYMREVKEYYTLVEQAREWSVNPAMQVAQRLLAVWLGPAITPSRTATGASTRC